ncbi:MAG TPA: SAM-dependent methyltransferase, partial [Acidimicrobiales bacterium]|nr:SAM-dependent methyltransferase [Acidimicrobiales bacterium]
FVERALYAAGGFYETGGRAGRRGASFVTSPEVGPLFGAVLARALDAWWEDAGRPDEWVVVDAGAGPGTLAQTILAAEPVCGAALHLVCVERTAAQRELHPDGVTSRADLPPVADVIVANELLDNLPFGLLERTPDGWRPVEVGDDGATVPDTGGARIPVAARAAAWVTDARRRLRPGGRLLCLDYADSTRALASRPWTDWVRAFAGHERVDAPFAAPGTRDVTVVVPWDQLPPPDETLDQASWLRRHGVDELVEEGRRHWAEHAAAPDLAAVRMRSRIVEAEALLDPTGLGAFAVGEWRAPTP